MTNANARPHVPFIRITGVVVMVLAVALAGLAAAAPQAEAAKKKPRVVAISPFAAATMARLKYKPIAVGQTIGGERRKPKFLKGVRVLTLSHPNGPNLEQMARLRPDIVFSSPRWSKGTAAMKRLGIRVIYTDPHKVNQVYKTVTRIGKVLNRKRQARKANRVIRRQVRNATGFSGTRPRTLLLLGIGNTAMTFLKNSWGGQLVRMAGGNLIDGGASAGGGFANISPEKILIANPQRIIIVPHGSVEDISQVVDYIKDDPSIQQTDAVKNNKVFVSVDNELLQSGPDVGPMIRFVRRQFITK